MQNHTHTVISRENCSANLCDWFMLVFRSAAVVAESPLAPRCNEARQIFGHNSRLEQIVLCESVRCRSVVCVTHCASVIELLLHSNIAQCDFNVFVLSAPLLTVCSCVSVAALQVPIDTHLLKPLQVTSYLLNFRIRLQQPITKLHTVFRRFRACEAKVKRREATQEFSNINREA